MAKQELTPMMKQFYDMKEKHPTAILLFRCGDFYETYEQDACICAKVLDITLTKAEDGTHMAGFPHHALDTYLPKLVRYCNQPESIMKRVAICDQLEPPKPTKKSAVSELLNNLTTNNPNNNPQTTNTTMKLNLSNQSENQNVQNAQVNNTAIAPIKVAEGSVPMSPEAFRAEYPGVVDAETEEITADAEVKSERVKSEKSAAPKKQARPKAKVTLKRKVTIKRKKAEPKAENPEPLTTNPEPTAGLPAVRFSIVPYANKQGETGYFLFGFTSQEEAKGLADRMAKSVREGFRYENHVRYDVVGFPPRYAQMAQQMCDALNVGDAAAVAKIAASTFDVYAAAVADGKAESDRKRAERKEAEAKAKAKEVAKVKKSAGLYSKEDVAAMLADVLAGKDVPEEIKTLLAKAA